MDRGLDIAPPGTFPPATPSVDTIPIPDPGFGLDWAYTIPPSTRALLVTGRGILSTSATIFTRRVQLCLSHGPSIIARSANYAVQSARTVQAYTLSAGSDCWTATVGYDFFLHFPPRILLVPGDTVAIVTTNLQLGDRWRRISLRMLVWTEP